MLFLLTKTSCYDVGRGYRGLLPAPSKPDPLVMTPLLCDASVLGGSRKREALNLSVTLLRLVTEVVSIIASVSKVERAHAGGRHGEWAVFLQPLDGVVMALSSQHLSRRLHPLHPPTPPKMRLDQ